MGLCISTTTRHQITGRIDQGAINGGSQRQSRRTASIHVLDDDSLLHIFYLYRPLLLGENEDGESRLWGGSGRWARGRWWYRLAHVCQRWRSIILGSAVYLGLSLVCTYGTPVADMLAYSPHLPLIVDYFERDRDIITNDEEGILLALKQHDRVLRVRLWTPTTNLQEVIVAIDDEYPILEHLIIHLRNRDTTAILVFPEALQAPNLRHLTLRGFTVPIGSRLLTTAVGLVTLYLVMVHPSTYFHPNTLLQWISLMPHLETLTIYFKDSISNRDLERKLTHMPILAPVTLPNLRNFEFHGVSTYLDALVHWITAPRLQRLLIRFFNQPTFSIPRLLQLLNTAENLRFDSAKFWFTEKRVNVALYLRDVEMLAMAIDCWHLDWQVSSVVQISSLLSQMFSAVEHLTLVHEVHLQSSEEHNEVERTEWRNLLRSFSGVKTLWIDKGLVEELSRCLESEDGELPLEVLPELEELTYSGSGDTGDAFTSFIDARRNAGRTITLVRPGPGPRPGPNPSSTVSIAPANEAGSVRDT